MSESILANDLLVKWADAAEISAGFFWMALWAFILGYALSSAIQVFVTRKKMQNTMGDDSLKSISLGAFFGFISSSCSFSALATTKALFQKGASFISSIAFLLASANLVIELGIIISIFLGWQFVVGEYFGGLLLIFFCWLLVKIIQPTSLIKRARSHLGQGGEEEINHKSISKRMASEKEWAKVGKQYIMEWKMVWKDVTVGFTIAGIVAAFVPDSFFHGLFIGTESGEQHFGFLTLLEHTVVGPVAAFITFIGSMGNIPLAALLFGKGVSFAGVMAFIFSDLVVFPVLRINAKYYGWKMSLFILFLLFSSLIFTSLGIHYGLNALGFLPDPSQVDITESEFFKVDYTLFLNLAFLLITGILIYFARVKGKDVHYHKEMAPKSKAMEMTLQWFAFIAYAWLAVGLIMKIIIA